MGIGGFRKLCLPAEGFTFDTKREAEMPMSKQQPANSACAIHAQGFLGKLAGVGHDSTAEALLTPRFGRRNGHGLNLLARPDLQIICTFTCSLIDSDETKTLSLVKNI